MANQHIHGNQCNPFWGDRACAAESQLHSELFAQNTPPEKHPTLGEALHGHEKLQIPRCLGRLILTFAN
jgi:hypothetical protein